MPCIFKTVYKIWDDKDGNTIEVTTDPDGTKHIEIRCQDGGGYEGLMLFTQEQARMVARAITLLLPPDYGSPVSGTGLTQ